MSTRNAVALPHTRRLNDAFRDGILDASETVAFVCECGTPGCFRVVWLQAGDYDSRRDDLEWSAQARAHSHAPMREAA